MVENFAWTIASAADDPFGPRPAPESVCAPGRKAAAESEFNGFWFTVSTRLCSYAVAQTVLLQNVPRGATMRARFFHFTINVGDGGWRLALGVGDPAEVVFERTYPVPAKTMLIEETWPAARDYHAGEAVWFHVTNHGVNDWSLVDFTATGPHQTCPLTEEACAAAEDCKFLGRCRLDGERCSCVVGGQPGCAGSSLCEYYGHCVDSADQCVAVTPEHCKAAIHCGQDGYCSPSEGECIAATDADCVASESCRRIGQCYAVKGGCEALSDADCEAAESCEFGGQCSMFKGICVALTEADCARSQECTDGGACTVDDGYCVKKAPGS